MREMECAAIAILEKLAPYKSWKPSLYIDDFQYKGTNLYESKNYQAKRAEYGLYQLMMNGWLQPDFDSKAHFQVTPDFIKRVRSSYDGKGYTEGWEGQPSNESDS
jgi:hypothetical protein